jgi:hypothetical protein
MRALLVLLVACRGSSGTPASGSGSSTPGDEGTRAIACAPAAAKVTLGVHDDHPLACWDETCVRDGERRPKAARPDAWLRPAEVRMERGVLSACNDGCRALHARLAERIAKSDPEDVSVTSDLDIVLVDKEVWRPTLDQPMVLVMPMELFGSASVVQSRVVVAGRFFLATLDGHGQLYDATGARIGGSALHGWDPGEVAQLDEQTFVVTDRSAPRFAVFDLSSGHKLWSHDQLAGFAIDDVVRLRDGAGAILMHDEAGWWIATFTPEEPKLLALDHVPLCH